MSERQFSPAAERNRVPIGEELRELLNSCTNVLEVASGTGQHAAWLSQFVQKGSWQPSDRKSDNFGSIQDWATESSGNVLVPIVLDMTDESTWVAAPSAVDLVFCANMIHISPWQATEGLIRLGAQQLRQGGHLVVYGPFWIEGREREESNVNFDTSLKNQNPEWGIREFHKVHDFCRDMGLKFVLMEPMPANNVLVRFRKV